MINGFVLEVVNENTTEVIVTLFKNASLPNGVRIHSRNSQYDYNSLFQMSIDEGFMGSGISTDDERISRITIYKDSNPTSFEFNKILDNLEIIIDGQTNYISLVIPPSSDTIIQLMPLFNKE